MMTMIKCILLVVFLPLALSDNLSSKIQLNKLENYQLNNYTGISITADIIAVYSKTINNAYSYFGSDLRQSSEYISTQLQSTYGWTYSVVILLTNETIGAWFIPNSDTNLVCWTKVNTYQPNWVYIIWPRYKQSSQTADYINGLGKGQGIDQQKQTMIRNIIKSQELTVSSCDCYSIISITNKLVSMDGQNWSIICKKYSATNFNARLQSKNHQYIQLYINADKCEYLLATD